MTVASVICPHDSKYVSRSDFVVSGDIPVMRSFLCTKPDINKDILYESIETKGYIFGAHEVFALSEATFLPGSEPSSCESHIIV